MGDSTQANAPEGWISLPEAVEHFMELSSELFPLDRNPFDGSHQDAGDELSGIVVRSYVLCKCERLIDRNSLGVLTNAGSVETVDDRDAIRHGLFDLELGILGRRLTLADAFAGTDPSKSELPGELEQHRDAP